jgi:hypothetical protein
MSSKKNPDFSNCDNFSLLRYRSDPVLIATLISSWLNPKLVLETSERTSTGCLRIEVGAFCSDEGTISEKNLLLFEKRVEHTLLEDFKTL